MIQEKFMEEWEKLGKKVREGDKDAEEIIRVLCELGGVKWQ